MKTIFLLSDANQGVLITVLGGIITASLIIIIPLLFKIFNRQTKSNEQMDGLKTELVNATAELNRIQGNREGRQELKQELKAEDSTGPLPVVVTKNLDK